MPEPRIKTTIEFDPADYERLRAYADHHDLGLASAIMGLLDGKLARVPFQPPSVEEVAQHCKDRGYSFDPESFVAFYESKGWKVGNQPMRKWRSACVTWSKRHADDNGQNGHVTDSADSHAEADREAAAQKQVAEELAELDRIRKERGL